MWDFSRLDTGLLWFLIFINDIHPPIKFSEVHHFADDTNFLNVNSSVKAINRKIIMT